MRIFFLFLLILFFPLFPRVSHAQETILAPHIEESYAKGKITDILETGKKDITGANQPFQKLRITLLDGSEKDKTITLEYIMDSQSAEQQKMQTDDVVIIRKTTINKDKTTYAITDRYRLPMLGFLLLGFALLVVITAQKKGIGAIMGMAISLFIILKFIVPAIIAGTNPILVITLGAFAILLLTLFLAHGFSKQTTVAFFATSITLLIAIALAQFTIMLANLTGTGNEDTYMLQFGLSHINVQGLLLGGIIIGALGVLDDITTAQSATIFTIYETDRKLTLQKLFTKGMRIGREHIASLVNTLVLAYAGASLGLFILFVLNPTHQPYWVILNSEIIAEEVARTLVGSASLILAVPITTLLATWTVITFSHEE